MKVYAHEEYIEHHRHSNLVRVGGMLPQTILQLLKDISINEWEGKCSSLSFILPICRVLGELQLKWVVTLQEKERLRGVLSITYAALSGLESKLKT